MSKEYVKPKFTRLKFEHSEGYESLCSITAQCKICGWGMIDVCCNFEDELEVVDKLGEDQGDWMTYCLNKGCQNHLGVYYSGGGSNDLDKLDVKLIKEK